MNLIITGLTQINQHDKLDAFGRNLASLSYLTQRQEFYAAKIILKFSDFVNDQDILDSAANIVNQPAPAKKTYSTEFTAQIKDGLIVFKSDYNPDFVSRLKLIGLKYDGSVWSGSASRANVISLNSIFKTDLPVPEKVALKIIRERGILYFITDSPETKAQIKKLDPKISRKYRCQYLYDTILNRQLLSKMFPAEFSFERKILNPGYDGNPIMMQHQGDGFEISKEKPRWGYWYDTGVGKTLMAIEIMKLIRGKTLILCPLSIINSAWIEDIKKFAPELMNNVKNLHGLTKKKFAQALKEKNVCLINFESFRTKAEEFKKYGWNILIIDESSKVKSAQSKQSKISQVVADFADNVPNCYLLSGTPAPNKEFEYFNQIRILDPSIWGRSFYRFRTRYFDSDYNGFNFSLKPSMREQFLSELASVSSVVLKKDVLNLLPVTKNIREVHLSPKELKAYREMAKNFSIQLKTDSDEDSDQDKIEAKSGAIKYMKLRQLTAGFAIETKTIKIQPNGEIITTPKKIHEFGTSKLKELSVLLEEIGNRQVIIWHQFTHEVKQIGELLKNKTVGFCNGDVKQSDRDIFLEGFKAGDIQYLVAHPKTISHGHTLTSCSDAIYYSISASYEGDKQSRDRIYRKGQKQGCNYYYLLVPKSIDPVIYQALQEKKSVVAAVMEYIKNFR